MALQVNNKYRVRTGVIASNDLAGCNGSFLYPHPRFRKYSVHIRVSDGSGWEHVSVSIVRNTDFKTERCPTWEEMCWVKMAMWEAEDCVVQYHPKESEYVNCHPHVLHLWRPTNLIIPTPPKIFV